MQMNGRRDRQGKRRRPDEKDKDPRRPQSGPKRNARADGRKKPAGPAPEGRSRKPEGRSRPAEGRAHNPETRSRHKPEGRPPHAEGRSRPAAEGRAHNPETRSRPKSEGRPPRAEGRSRNAEPRFRGKPDTRPHHAEGRGRKPEIRSRDVVREVRPEPVVEKPLPPLPTSVQNVAVTPDENGMRVDRFLESRFPGLSFSHIQRIIRKGELRVNGKRAQPKDRIEAGQNIRIPPLRLDQPRPLSPEREADQQTKDFLKSIILYEDDDVMVFNKPMGLSVQGGSGTTRHLDGMLEVLRQPGVDGQKPRLVHRLDKDTAGCLLVAKSRFAAAALAKNFRSRSARKTYWALVVGAPKPKQGRISTYLAKEEREDDSIMRVAEHGEDGASHAVTYYAMVETAGQKLAWMSLKPVTGRTHQLRAHMAHIGHPIIGDPKYFQIENWELPGGLQNKLHLLARRIAIPHPRGGVIDVTAPLPPHMQQSWNLLGFDTKRYDPIEDAPET